MTDLTHLVALSLLPTSSWRHAAECLRAGDFPETVFDRLVTQEPGATPERRSSLQARAAVRNRPSVLRFGTLAVRG